MITAYALSGVLSHYTPEIDDVILRVVAILMILSVYMIARKMMKDR